MTSKISMRKLVSALALSAVVLVLSVSSSSAADSPAVGWAETTLTLLSETNSGLNLAGEQSPYPNILIGDHSGVASSDVSYPNGGFLARIHFLASRGSSTLDDIFKQGELDFETNNGSTGTSTDTPLPINVPSLATGSVVASGVQAVADPANYLAHSAIGNGSIDASVADSTALISGADIGVINDSDQTRAHSVQGINIQSISIGTIGDLIDRLSSISPDSILSLALEVAPSSTSSERTAVTDAKAALLAAVNAEIAAINALTPPPIPDIPTVDSSISLEDLIQLVTNCGSPLTGTGICDLSAVQDALTTLNDAVSDLHTKLSAFPILAIDDLNIGVDALATDTDSSSSAAFSWGSVRVAGIDVPGMVDAAGHNLGIYPNSDAAFDAISDEVEVVQGHLNSVPGLEGVDLALSAFQPTATHGMLGAYYVAGASVKGLTLSYGNPNPVAAEGGEIMRAFTSSVVVGSMDSKVQHKPQVLGARFCQGAGCSNGSTPKGPLASTGTDPMFLFGGLLALGLALGLRRWLGDAA